MAARADQGAASGVLQEVFEITGRGCVGVFGALEGVVNVGDRAGFPDGALTITGIEMVRFSDPSTRPKDTVGLLLDGADRDALRTFCGERIAFEAGDA